MWVCVCVCVPTIIKRFPCGRTYICTNMFVCKHSWVCVYFFSPKVSGESNENITPLLVILGDPVVFFVCFVSSASSTTTSQRRTRMILLSYSHRQTHIRTCIYLKWQYYTVHTDKHSKTYTDGCLSGMCASVHKYQRNVTISCGFKKWHLKPYFICSELIF